jgi:hypothetical protein
LSDIFNCEKSEKSEKCGNSLSDNGRGEGFFEKGVKILADGHRDECGIRNAECGV